MVSKDADKIRGVLNRFGLEENECNIFTFLLLNGQSTISTISKNLNIPRPTVYRITEKLLLTQLIKEVLTPNGKTLEAGSIKELELILNQRKEELISLEKGFKDFEKIVHQIQIPEIAQTKVVSYKGIEGLKQITWNSTKAKDQLRIMELSTMSAFLDRGFSERARTEFLLNKIFVKEITNLNKLGDYTDIQQFVTDYWECRNIQKSLFEIKFEILIYNNVYTMYNYQGLEIVGVEIYNEKLAEMQKQIFDSFWEQGRRMKKIDSHGSAEIEKEK